MKEAKQFDTYLFFKKKQEVLSGHFIEDFLKHRVEFDNDMFMRIMQRMEFHSNEYSPDTSGFVKSPVRIIRNSKEEEKLAKSIEDSIYGEISDLLQAYSGGDSPSA